MLSLIFFAMSLNITKDKIFNNRPSKICERQPLKNFTSSIHKYFVLCRPSMCTMKELFSLFLHPRINFSDNHCVKNVGIWSYSGLYSVQMRENTDQNNSKYGHFSRSESLHYISLVVQYYIHYNFLKNLALRRKKLYILKYS